MLQNGLKDVSLGICKLARGLYTGQNNRLGPAGFAFDIDGVLVRGGGVLSEAKKAMALLHDGSRFQHPVCFLTNSGGYTESRKAEQLTEWLQVRVDAQQVVLSHTPFRPLAKRLGSRPVLVSGRNETPAVAAAYGYRDFVTSLQLGAAYPHAVPFSLSAQAEARQHPEGAAAVRERGIGTPDKPLEALLVFTDPDDWYLDLQLMTDLLVSGGSLHGPRPPERRLEVFFSNPDVLWANEFPAPRFGQGGFVAALEGLYNKRTGSTLPKHTFFGKPNSEPYRLAEAVLSEQSQQLGLLKGNTNAGGRTPLGTIYAVGDNPKADIAGANAAGDPWVSMLVRTGVFTGPNKNDAEHPAAIVVDTVLDAVKAGLHRIRSQGWHSMR